MYFVNILPEISLGKYILDDFPSCFIFGWKDP